MTLFDGSLDFNMQMRCSLGKFQIYVREKSGSNDKELNFRSKGCKIESQNSFFNQIISNPAKLTVQGYYICGSV